MNAEDPRRYKRRDRALRVGDDVDGVPEQQCPEPQGAPLPPPQPCLAPLPNPSLPPLPLISAVTSEALRKARQDASQENWRCENLERTTAANPTVPRPADCRQGKKESGRAKGRDGGQKQQQQPVWQPPLEASLLQADTACGTLATSNAPQSEMGIPNNNLLSIPAYSHPMVSVPPPPLQLDQSCSQPSQLCAQKQAEAVLLQFMGNPLSAVNSAASWQATCAPFTTHSQPIFNSPPPQLPSAGLPETSLPQVLSCGLDVSLEMRVLCELASESAIRNSTRNIHLVLDRLAQTPAWVSSIPPQITLQYLREYYPCLAAIKKWQKGIAQLLWDYKVAANELRGRRASDAAGKLILLKRCAAKGKEAVDAARECVRTMTMVSDLTAEAQQVATAYVANERQFSFLHPDQNYLLAAQLVLGHYRATQDTAGQLLPLSLSSFGEPATGAELMGELVRLLAEESGGLCELQRRVRVMMRRAASCEPVATAGLQKAREHWRMMDLLREVGSILRHRALWQ